MGDMMGSMGGEDDYDDYGGEGEGEEPSPEPVPARILETEADFDSFLDDDDAAVVGFFEPPAKVEGETEDGMVPDLNAQTPEDWDSEEDGPWAAPLVPRQATLQEVYGELASRQTKFRWAVTNSPALLQQHRLKNAVAVFKSPRFVSTKHGDRPRARYPGSTFEQEGALLDFVTQNSQPLVGMLTASSQHFYEAKGLPVLTLFSEADFQNNRKNSNYFLNRLRKVAVKFKSRIVFSMASKTLGPDSNLIPSLTSFELANYGVKLESGWDAVGTGIMHNDMKGGAQVPSYYWMASKFSVDNLEKFCSQYLEGKLQKAERLPTEYDTSESLDQSLMGDCPDQSVTNEL